MNGATTLVGGLTLLVLIGCGPRADAVEGEGGATAGGEGVAQTGGGATSAEGWPEHLLTSEGTGPALYLTSTPDSPALGYVSPGVVLRVASGPENERLPVWVDGPLKVRGWLPFERLAARAQHRGRVEDTPAYVGPNDMLGVRGLAGEDMMRVVVQPWLGHQTATTIGPFTGRYPARFLAASEIDPSAAEGPTPGEPRQLPAGQEVPVYDRPNGQVVATLPATTPPLVVVKLVEQGEWKGIRAGVGPYVVGFVNVSLEPTTQQPQTVGGLVGEAVQQSPVPARLMAEADRPLWRVPAGTRVKFDGETIAQLQEAGWAREMNRYETGEVDAFIAVNDDVAIRGMVAVSALQPVEGQPAPQPAQPETGAPAEPTAPEPAQPTAPAQPAQPQQPPPPRGAPGTAQPLQSPQ